MESNYCKEINHRTFIRYENIFSSDLLKEVENIGKKSSSFNDTGGDPNYQRKTSCLGEIPLPPLFLNKLQSSIVKANDTFKMDLENFDIKYVEYQEKVSGLDWHLDIGPYPYNLRKLSFSINFNNPNEYKGGDLEFQYFQDAINKSPKSQGGITIFPSFLLHRVTPIVEGTRKAVIGMVLGKTPYK